MLNDYWNVVRLFNIVMQLAIITAALLRYFRRRTDKPETRLRNLAMAGVLGSNVYSSVDLYLKGNPGGVRVLIASIALIWLTIAMFYPYVLAATLRLEAGARWVSRRLRTKQDAMKSKAT